jgi:hypothetical protein
MEVNFNREVRKSLSIINYILKLLLDIGGCQVLRGFSAYTYGFLLRIYSQTLLLKVVFGLEQYSSSHHIQILLLFLRFFY